MYPRTEYEMSEAQLIEILEACKPVPYMVIGGMPPRSPQENANAAWAVLGKTLGFDYMTVRPIPGKSQRFFTAIPSETPEQRQTREHAAAEERRKQEIVRHEAAIREHEKALSELRKPTPPAD